MEKLSGGNRRSVVGSGEFLECEIRR